MASMQPVAMSSSSPLPSVPPRLLVVLGCTGVGKTKISLELAHRCNAEIISCDSIQLYAGLPIGSNQVALEEANGIRHHLIASLPPWTATTVHGFRTATKKLIGEITARGRNVIIVAGTFYWLESVLYKTFINRDEERMEDEESRTDVTQADTEKHEGHSSEPELQVAQWHTAFTGNDAPLTLEQLQHLSSTSLPSLSVMALSFACHQLLCRTRPTSLIESLESATRSLLLHLAANCDSETFDKILDEIPNEAVRSVSLVKHLLKPLPNATSSNTESAAAASPSSTSQPNPSIPSSFSASFPSSFPPSHLYSLLCRVDPSSGAKLHPNNERRVRRALEVFVEYGGRSTWSELLSHTGGQRGFGGVQYPCLLFWLDCDMDVLDERLDRRVDRMMERGLREEAEQLYKTLWTRQERMREGKKVEAWKYDSPLDPQCSICSHVECKDIPLGNVTKTSSPASTSLTASSLPAPPHPISGTTPSSSLSSHSSTSPSLGFDYLGSFPLDYDWQRGLGQALGFKEFLPYFKLKFHTQQPTTETPDERQEDRPNKRQKTITDSSPSTNATLSTSSLLFSCLSSCISSLKRRTRVYARHQTRWIRTRLIKDPQLLMIRLDATRAEDPTKWQTEVSLPAIEAATKFIQGQEIDIKQYGHLAAKLPPVPTAAANDDDHAASTSDSTPSSSSSSSVPWQKYFCSSCSCTCNGSHEWQRHLVSRRHRTLSTRQSRKEMQMKRQEEVAKMRREKREAMAAATAKLSSTT